MPELSFAATSLVRDTCLCLHAQRAARALARRFDEALRPVGLTSGQFSLLMSLNRPNPATMASVSAILAMDRTTLTANLKPLERRGYLRVVQAETDRRRRDLLLTEEGRQTLAAALPIWLETHRSIERLLNEPGPDRLRDALRTLADSTAMHGNDRGASKSISPIG